MIDPATIATTIQGQIATSVEQTIRDYVANIIHELSLDTEWVNKIEQQVNEKIARNFGQRLSLIDLDNLISKEMDSALNRWFARQPQKQAGVQDLATSVQVTVADDAVVIHPDLKAGTVTIAGQATVADTLTVKNLAVKGTINTDNKTWQELTDSITQQTLTKITQEWKQELVQDVQQQITGAGIDFSQVTVDGQKLIADRTLASAVLHSSLKSVGVLDNLTVAGSADITNSLSVRARRVGINTQHPDMALTVWDEEVALVMGKHKDQTAYLGTIRPQRLIIGINRQPAIDINDQARVTIQHLTVGRHRMCHEPECPNYSGNKGDIVFNSNPKNDGIWGWQCLGAFRWMPLRSA